MIAEAFEWVDDLTNGGGVLFILLFLFVVWGIVTIVYRRKSIWYQIRQQASSKRYLG